jgi:hypothetical protein
LEEKSIMQPYEQLTSEKLAALPAGTQLKIGDQLIHLVGIVNKVDAAGHPISVVEFLDGLGNNQTIDLALFRQSATEHLDAVHCAYCYALRAPSDCVKRVIAHYHFTRFVNFCSDKDCAKKYFTSHPEQISRPRRRFA